MITMYQGTGKHRDLMIAKNSEGQVTASHRLDEAPNDRWDNVEHFLECQPDWLSVNYDEELQGAEVLWTAEE